MNITFLVQIETDAVDIGSIQATADDMHAHLDEAFDVIDVKPWARPTAGLPSDTTTPTTGVPPVSGTL